MARADDKGILIGILDIHGNEIGNGDRIRVQHINYKDTPRERIDDEFIAKVFYHGFTAAFLYKRENVPEPHHTYNFNHRSSRFEILESN